MLLFSRLQTTACYDDLEWKVCRATSRTIARDSQAACIHHRVCQGFNRAKCHTVTIAKEAGAACSGDTHRP